MKSIVSASMVIMVLVGTLVMAFDVRSVRASGTIHIRADGSIDPPTAPISTVDNITYTLTSSINDSIVVERYSIVVDGAGFLVHGQGATGSRGIEIVGRTNVTIKNMRIENFEYGVWLSDSDLNSISGSTVTNNQRGVVLDSSFNNSISESRITNNLFGILLLDSYYNSMNGNNITTNSLRGIFLGYSNYNSISGNNIIENNEDGILLTDSYANCISGNNIEANIIHGVYLSSSSNNDVYHNNFINNTWQVYSSDSINTWDDGYPSGGNFWSDYSGTDSDSDGIGDTPYIIDIYNTDNYPLMGTFGSLTLPGENVVVFPANDVCVTYQTVTSGGLTTVEKPSTGPAPPAGFTVKQYYIIETTADYAGNISIKIICDMSVGARGDATLQEGWQLLQCVMLAGDVNEDFDVDIFDIVRIAGHYLAVEPDPRYDPQCDIDHDGDTDVFDIVRAAGNYGSFWDPATGWSDITTRVDEESNSIFGVTQHLSIFGVTRG